MLLSAEHLSINFGSRQLLDDVNFYLNEGDKVGVIGINGTGKSTFLKVLSGVTELLTRHLNMTSSNVAKKILENFDVELQHFVKVFPVEYFNALNAMKEAH